MLKTAIYLPFLIGMLQFPVAVKAQLNKEKGEKHIIVNAGSIHVDALLELFSRETGLEFSFNSKQLSPSRVIKVTHHDQTVAAWLKELERTTGIRFKIKGDHIILEGSNTTTSEPATAASSGPITKVNDGPGTASSLPQRTMANTSAASQEKRAGRNSNVNTPARQYNDTIVKHTNASRQSYDVNKRNTDTARQSYDTNMENSSATDTSMQYINKNNPASGKSKKHGHTGGTAEAFSPEVSALAEILEAMGGEELELLYSHELPAPEKTIRPVSRDEMISARPEEAKDTNARADARQASQLRPLTKLDLGIQGIGISFERKMGRKFIIDLSAGIGGGYEAWYGSFGYTWDLLNPVAYFSVNPRYYYNLGRRYKKGKTSFLNAGNYIGFRLKYTTRNLIDTGGEWDTMLANIHWGIQRPMGRKWLINGHLGLGYAYDITDLNNFDPVFAVFYPAVECKISYVLNRKRSLR